MHLAVFDLRPADLALFESGGEQAKARIAPEH